MNIHNGNNIDILREYPDNHFDAIVTDPPYGIEFLAKEWDKNTGAVETWQECFRVLKPGGYILAFSAARTYHHLATNIESVGFEIRDQLMWLYSSGFPKAQDIGKAIERREGKRNTGNGFDSEAYTGTFAESTGNERAGGIGACNQCGKNNMAFPKNYNKCEQEPCFMREQARAPDNEWAGWKTALKPAHEPIVMARKPFKGSTIDNVLTHGVGALNIDATRIPVEDDYGKQWSKYVHKTNKTEFDGPTGGFGAAGLKDTERKMYNDAGRFPSNVLGEVEGYQQYFYCPKVSRAERHIGFEDPGPRHPGADGGGYQVHNVNKDLIVKKQRKGNLDHIPAPFGNVKGAYVNGERMAKVADDNQYASAGNNHPTVKPVALMRYLIKLITPPGGKVLDPFCGSGSTGMAAVELGCDFTGCELDADYVNIAKTRIQAWKEKTDLAGNKLPAEFFEE